MKRMIVRLVVWALVSPAAAETVRFTIDDPMNRDTVQFKTSAPLEDIIGLSNSVKGEIQVNLENLKSPETQGRIEVDLASLKTGIEMRDEHLRKGFLRDRQVPESGLHLGEGPLGVE